MKTKIHLFSLMLILVSCSSERAQDMSSTTPKTGQSQESSVHTRGIEGVVKEVENPQEYNF